MLIVFYDGKCGLCRREIAHYQHIAVSGTFRWVDITTTPQALMDHGVSLNDGLKQLHVMDDDGVMHVGVDAFACLWGSLPAPWSIAGRCLKQPWVRFIAKRLYGWFARWRYRIYGYGQCDL